MGRDGAGYELIWVKREMEMFLLQGLDRLFGDLPVMQNGSWLCRVD
jgi:hypothetical protein